MLFEETSHSYIFLHKSGSLWKDCFKLFELTETVCQKDDKRFAELLGRFRTGDCTAENFILLQSCQITQNDVTYLLYLEQMLMLISTTMKCLRNHVQDIHYIQFLQKIQFVVKLLLHLLNHVDIMILVVC